MANPGWRRARQTAPLTHSVSRIGYVEDEDKGSNRGSIAFRQPRHWLWLSLSLLAPGVSHFPVRVVFQFEWLDIRIQKEYGIATGIDDLATDPGKRYIDCA
jgi:hypothetical protein